MPYDATNWKFRPEEEARQGSEGRREHEKAFEKDTKERPAATVAERIRFPECVTGKRLSYSTV